MKFLIDADLPNSTVQPFLDKGYEAEHVREVGLGDAEDSRIADYANQNSFFLVTRDRDFGNPLLSNKVDEGVLILKLHNYSPLELKDRISIFLDGLEIAEITGRIVVIEEERYRVSEY